MGILNATPDSFYDGGRYPTLDRQKAQVDQLLAEGADLIDIGGESTKPGSESVAAEVQIERIEGVLQYALQRGVVVSVDTTLPKVADHALRLGARLINDVSCLADVDLAHVVARHGAHLLIGHSRGAMSNMPGFSQWPDDDYDDIVQDITKDWERARQGAVRAGVPRENILFDPGLGFSKNARHCFVILQRLQEFKRLGAALVVSPARKSFIAAVDPSPAEQRIGGTIAACLIAAQRGADVLRIHDVGAVRQALAVSDAATNGLPDPVGQSGAEPAGDEVKHAR